MPKPAVTIPVLRDAIQQLPAAYTFVDVNTRGALAGQAPRVIFIEVTNHCKL